MLMTEGFIQDIQLDPLRERIFVIRVDSTDIYVLRDVKGGVVEEPASVSPASGPGLQVQPTSDGFDLSYVIASTCRVDLSIHDQIGRIVRQLVAEEQAAGQHRVTWDCRDTNRTSVAHGVYFHRLDTPGFRSVKKAVVTR
jgi:hypothetical protein